MDATGLTVIATCGAMLIGGVVLTARWSGLVLTPPAVREGGGQAALRALWWVGLGTASGAASGALIIGAGGRVIMRLLAVTAGDHAQGGITEADATVGEITVGGTIGFLVFVGLLLGALTGLLFVALHWWLPAGRAAGACFGVLLLVLLASRVEPLRTNNEDFDLVGPAWLSISLFALLGPLQGMAVAAFAARWSRTQPLLTSLRAVPRYLPMVPILLGGLPALLLALLIGSAVAAEKLRLRERIARRAVIFGGRAILVAVLFSALPGFVTAVSDIAGRSP
jgi:hypothetical protein